MRVPELRDWLRTSTAVALALALAIAPAAGLAADDEEDDFLNDDFADDFLEEDYVEKQEEAKKRNEIVHWAFNVPVDILLSRPLALTDTAVGGLFLGVATPILGLFGAGKSAYDWARGEGWYFDRGNIQAATQLCVTDPWEYAWNRPLGQLSSEF